MAEGTSHDALNGERGRDARRPRHLGRKGWRDVLLRVREETQADNITVIAAGVAFYAMLALIPAIAALVSIYGLVADPATVREQIQGLGPVLPDQARQIVIDQLSRAAAQSSGTLSLTFIGSLLVSLWSANKGMRSLITAINIAYDEDEKRGFLKKNAISLLFTVGAILGITVALFLIVGIPLLFGAVGLSGTAEVVSRVARWPILFELLLVGLGLLYRYGPVRTPPQFRWASWGAVVATALFLVFSGLFSLYVSNFGSYHETYGSLGAVVVLLLWLFVSAFAVLLGAELNAEMEHQTRHDTTIGGKKPMGERGAYLADHLGRSP